MSDPNMQIKIEFSKYKNRRKAVFVEVSINGRRIKDHATR
jgi:hypothetical protein